MVDHISTVSYSKSKNFRAVLIPRGRTSARKFIVCSINTAGKSSPAVLIQRGSLSARIRIYLQNAISTANQGPKREKMSTKNQGKKSHVRVPLSLQLAVFLMIKTETLS